MLEEVQPKADRAGTDLHWVEPRLLVYGWGSERRGESPKLFVVRGVGLRGRKLVAEGETISSLTFTSVAPGGGGDDGRVFRCSRG